MAVLEMKLEKGHILKTENSSLYFFNSPGFSFKFRKLKVLVFLLFPVLLRSFHPCFSLHTKEE